jgi:predicted ATPase/DNA-binding SARP family transcriptional activator
VTADALRTADAAARPAPPPAAHVLVGVLGPVVAFRAGEPVSPVPTVTKAVLGALAVAAPASITSEALITAIWPKAPRDARAALQLGIHRLRGWLRQTVGDDVTIHTVPTGYRLDLRPPGVTDLHQFRALVARAGDVGMEAYPVLRQAIALWRGPPLDDLPPHRVDEVVLAALAAERTEAIRRCAAAALDRDKADQALGLVRPLCTADPLDEEAHAILVEALGASGRQSAALIEYDRVRRSLATELGIMPGELLRRAHQRVLRAAPRAGAPPAGAPHTEAPPAGTAPARWRGPRPHVRLVGRDAARRALTDLLTAHRIVTVIGPGGVGKTVLALDAAHAIGDRFADGVVVATLQPATDTASAVLAVGAVLGVDAGRPDDVLAAVERQLSDRNLLVVLDNCEHLVTAVAPIVGRLVAAAKGVVVLATSRQPLGISGEVVWQLGTLPVPATGSDVDTSQPAVELFVQRAAEAVPGLRFRTGELPDVGAICRRLDGLPLAIELAAARLRTFDVRTLAAQLATDLVLLSTGSRGDDPRHGTLTAVVEWSYRLLDDAERRLLARLSVFRGGFTLNAAMAVCGGPPLTASVVPAGLVALVERSLVQPYEAPDGRRYLMSEAVREFAAERLAETAEAPQLRDAHLDFWLAFARHIHGWTADYPRWEAASAAHSADVGNLRAALEHGYDSGRIDEAVELTATLFDFWIHIGAPGEAERWLRKARPHLAGVPARVRALAQFNLGIIEARHEQIAAAVQLVRPVLADLDRYDPDEAQEAWMFTLASLVRLLDPAALAMTAPVLERVLPDWTSRRVRAVSLVVEALLTWGRTAEAGELASNTDPYAEPVAAFVIHHRTVTRLAADLCLGRPISAADYLRTVTDPPPRPPMGANANLVLALLMLATGRLEPYRSLLLRSMAALVDSDPATRAGILRPSIYLAEAERRAGELGSALVRLRPVLGWAAEGTNLFAGQTAVLVTALLAHDLGDVGAGRDLAAAWDLLRRPAGLAAPVGLGPVLVERFGLDARAPGDPAPDLVWRPEPFLDVIAAARSWHDRHVDKTG